MSLIVAGRFTTFADAEAAANRLFEAGFVQEDVTLFFVNPRGQHARFPIGGDRYVDPEAARTSKGAGKGGAIGAVIGAVIGVALFSAFSSPFLVLVVAAGVGVYRFAGRCDVAYARWRQGARACGAARSARFRGARCRSRVARQSSRSGARVARGRKPGSGACPWPLAARALGRFRSHPGCRADHGAVRYDHG